MPRADRIRAVARAGERAQRDRRRRRQLVAAARHAERAEVERVGRAEAAIDRDRRVQVLVQRDDRARVERDRVRRHLFIFHVERRLRLRAEAEVAVAQAAAQRHASGEHFRRVLHEHGRRRVARAVGNFRPQRHLTRRIVEELHARRVDVFVVDLAAERQRMFARDERRRLPLIPEGRHAGLLGVAQRRRQRLFEAIVFLPVDRKRPLHRVERAGLRAVVAHVAEVEPLRIERAAIETVAADDAIVAADVVLLLVHVEAGEARAVARCPSTSPPDPRRPAPPPPPPSGSVAAT